MKRIPIPKLYSFLLIFFPLVSNLDVFIITPMLFFCVVCSLLALLWMISGHKIKLDRKVAPYLLYLVFSTVLSIVIYEGASLYSITIRLLLNISLVFVFYVCYWQIFDYKYAITCYIKISIILSIVIAIQFALSLVGKGICLVPPGIPVTSGPDLKITTDVARNTQITLNRYSSIFLEPAHQAAYTLPCLAIVLFQKEYLQKKDIVTSVLLTVGIFCTTSSMGILGSLIIWAFYLCSLLISGKIRKEFWMVFLLPLLIVIVAYFLSKEDVSKNLIARLAILNVNNKESTTGFRRIRYGWLCFGSIDFPHKLLGLGYKNFGHYLLESGIGYKFSGLNTLSTVSYANGITSMLLGLGFIGTFLNLRLYIVNAIRSKNFFVYSLLLVWGELMFSSASFDELSSLTLIVFIMYLVSNEKRCINLKLCS